MNKPAERVIIENVTPQIDGGEFYAKSIIGNTLKIEADVFADGHDVVMAHVIYKHESDKKERASFLYPLGNDHWAGAIKLDKIGFYNYTVEAWIDYPLTWQYGFKKKVDANVDVSVEILECLPFLKNLEKNENLQEIL